MNDLKKNNFLFNNISFLNGIGPKLSRYLKKKKIEKINDLLMSLPYTFVDRSESVKLDKLEIGKILTLKIKVKKYNFPRIRNLPNTIKCEDENGEIDIVYFNSREGYLRKIFPINNWVIVSGKINYFRNKYQMTNPDYVSTLENISKIKKEIPKYSLTEGINEKKYLNILQRVIDQLIELNEWHNKNLIKKLKFKSWKNSIVEIHKSSSQRNIDSIYYRRLAFDEIISHLVVLSNNRKKIKKIKKKPKRFDLSLSNKVLKTINFTLTNDQDKTLKEINNDLKSSNRMFRVLQGDVGSGKTIVSFLACANVIESNFQAALMAPTEILAKQHFNLAKKIFINTKINIQFISGKSEYKEKKVIIEKLAKGEIDFIIGTHSLFQKKINFKSLGIVVIDEQHKFGVKQRLDFAKKGGDESDVLVMSATPIPRTMMLAIYGDMDVSKITEKPNLRKDILTLSKPEEKINELWPYINKELKKGNQIFWVCPLIDESQYLNYTSAIKRFKEITKKFKNQTGLLHGSMDKSEKEKVLNDFLNKKINILVSTTVIEVGIDFPNANLIIIENSNKFGLAQLHQLRGRVGRGIKKGVCILLYKGSLTKNAIKRIKILKSSNDGFFISEEDMKLRGFGDVLGYQQSGIKNFKIADPVKHKDLFEIANDEMKRLYEKKESLDKYNFLLKLFDRAEIVGDLND